MRRDIRLLWVLCLVFLLGCAGATPAPPPTPVPAAKPAANVLRLVATSPYTDLAPAIKRFNSQTGSDVQMTIVESGDLRLMLQNCSAPIDAVGASDRLWPTLGDTCNLVKLQESMMRSPIVLGVKPSKARELKWDGREIGVHDVYDAVKNGQLSYAMPSASQSNVGVSALFSFIQALTPSGDPPTEQDLQDPAIRQTLTDLFSVVEHSSASAYALKQLVQQHYDQYQATFNYEAYILQINSELQPGQEPFQIYYLKDALATADVPLGYVDHGNPQTRDLFLRFKNFLQQDGKADMSAKAWRTGLFGTGFSAEALAKYATWGFKEEPNAANLNFPRAEVLVSGMTAFQTQFRPPSDLRWVLDTSGSMGTNSFTGNKQDAVIGGKNMYRIEALRLSMQPAIDPTEAGKYLLQPTAQDVNTVIPFSDDVISGWNANTWQVAGNDTKKLTDLWNRVNGLNAGGNTALYNALIYAIKVPVPKAASRYNSAIVVLTDGVPTTGTGYATLNDFKKAYDASGQKISIYAIGIGEADFDVLQKIVDIAPEEVRGEVFDGRKTDVQTDFRKIKAAH